MNSATPERSSILVVDDSPENLIMLGGMLQDHHRVKVSNSGPKALHSLQAGQLPDLILLDIIMPGMDGFEVCRSLKADPRTAEIPVIFLTGLSDVADETLGLQLGAVDYIFKPISPAIVLARVQTHLKVKAYSDLLKNQNIYLEAEVLRRTQELRNAQDVTILALASLAETRDPETGHHLTRTQHFVRALALELRRKPDHAAELPDQRVDMIFKSAPLHDIGKVGIPDRILLKTGRLEPEEFEEMKAHSRIGHDAICQAERQSGADLAFLACAKEIALGHHERWNGTGYPLGLTGADIPLSARLMALADVYDALTSVRCYKVAMSHGEAAALITAERGGHFDPEIVDAFLAVEETFQAIATAHRGS